MGALGLAHGKACGRVAVKAEPLKLVSLKSDLIRGGSVDYNLSKVIINHRAYNFVLV